MGELVRLNEASYDPQRPNALRLMATPADRALMNAEFSWWKIGLAFVAGVAGGSTIGLLVSQPLG